MSPYGQSALVWTCKDQYWLVWLIMVFKDVVGWFLMSVPVCGPVLVHFTLPRVKNREWVKNREFLAFYSARFEMILITAFLGWLPPSPPLPLSLSLPHLSLYPYPTRPMAAAQMWAVLERRTAHAVLCRKGPLCDHHQELCHWHLQRHSPQTY